MDNQDGLENGNGKVVHVVDEKESSSLETRVDKPGENEEQEYARLVAEFERHHGAGAVCDLPRHPSHWIKNPVNTSVDLTSFGGEWLNWDPVAKDWLIRNIIVRDDEFLAYDTPPNKHKPGRGYVYNGQVYIYFSDEDPCRRHRPVKLADHSTIRFIGDPDFDEWIKKGSNEDPYEKFEKSLKIQTGKSSRDILAAIKSTRSPEEYLIGEGQFRSVAKEWMMWVALGDSQWIKRLVDDAADIMQNVPRLVRYLSLQLAREYQLDSKMKIENEPVIDLSTEEKSARATLEATRKVHRRIAALFAEMSDSKNFMDKHGKLDEKTFNGVKDALINHAIPIIVTKLPIEEDLETRRCFATVLGNMRLDHTVDALVDALVSDQQVRATRQKMIAEYYLQPSKQQSDEAAMILKGAVEESRRTLSLLQWLNVVIFMAGIFILVGGLYVSVTDADSRVAGALVGLGGFAGVITLLVNDPLNRIQNSLSNLVQLEAAFTSFIWELNLNSTYIQSQYVNKGLLLEEDVANTLSRIEGAMDFTMNQVAVYTDEGREVIVPHLTHLTTTAGKKGAIQVQVYGNHLKASGRAKEESDKVVVAVNHVPYLSIKAPDKKNMVSFDLQTEGLPQGLSLDGDNIWVSLVMNGYETNALSLKLSAAGLHQPSEADAQEGSSQAASENPAAEAPAPETAAAGASGA